MKFINTTIDLQEYIKRVDRQKEVLKLSPLFSDQEKEEIEDCFRQLVAICHARIINKIPIRRKTSTLPVILSESFPCLGSKPSRK